MNKAYSQFKKMRKSVLITGTPGVGKTTLSKTLGNLGYYVWDLESVPNLFHAIDPSTGQQVERNNEILSEVMNSDWICDAQLLKAIVNCQRTDIAFYAGTASNYAELIPLFTHVVLMQVSAQTLRNRLSLRPRTDFGGVPEVRDWTISWKDWRENEMVSQGAIVLDAEPPVGEVARSLISLI